MGAGLIRTKGPKEPQRLVKKEVKSDIEPIVDSVNEAFHKRWAAAKLAPASPGDELVRMRRLSLALCGTVPSLEEIRRFQKLGRRKHGPVSGWIHCFTTVAARTISPNGSPGSM